MFEQTQNIPLSGPVLVYKTFSSGWPLRLFPFSLYYKQRHDEHLPLSKVFFPHLQSYLQEVVPEVR